MRPPTKPIVSLFAWATRIALARSRETAGATHRNGSSQPRIGRATIVRPWTCDPARGRVVDAGDDVEERRLAGAVRADEADDRALRDVEADVVDRHEAAEPLRDVLRAARSRSRRFAAARRSSVELARRRRRRATAVGLPISAEVVGGMELPLAASGLGNRPSGLNSIISTSAMPYSRNWYWTKLMSSRIGTWSVGEERVELLEEHDLDRVDDERAEGDAPDVAHPAEHDHRQDRERHREEELVRADEGQLRGVEHAGETGRRRARGRTRAASS